MQEKSTLLTIGIPIDAALKIERTGVEEYTFQLVSHFLKVAQENVHYKFIFYSSFPEEKVREVFPVLSTKALASAEGQSNATIAYSPYKRFWFQRSLPHLIAQYRPDVFFSPAHSIPNTLSLLRIPGVVTIHGMEWYNFPEHYAFLERLQLRMHTKNALEQAHGIIAVSAHTKKDIEDFSGKKIPHCTVIPHGVEIPARIPLRLPRTHWHILFIGRKDTRKNLKGATGALGVVRRIVPDISFTFSAVGPLGNDALVHKFPIHKNNSHIIEHINNFVSETDKKNYYKKADIFLFPSHDEGFGMPILEAQARGVPVVCSSFLQEVAGEGALYCDPSNPQTIASAILTLMLHPAVYDKIRKNARINAKRFSWEQCAQETLKFLEETRKIKLKIKR